jgi:Zn-dependent peptidase ImmA (M78 family)/DNA-binding XRE family transcriptional regulator
MGRAVEVPVTPSVIRWAIDESGYSVDDIALGLGVNSATLNDWADGVSKPTLTHARKLAAKLHRPFASLLLPAAPEKRPLPVKFRHSAAQRRTLNPSERRYLRRAARFQEVLGWLARELEIEMPRTPLASLNDDPVSVAAQVRRVLAITTASQKDWSTPSVAFDRWRARLEASGHLVFLFSLGSDSSQGFSLWNDFAPVVAVNSAWNEAARIFTLLHEVGHLVTRTSSACLEPRRTSSRTDPVERWCERFAAAVLMPASDVEETLRKKGWRAGTTITNLSIAKSVASLYKVSLRAAVIRIIEVGAAGWALYDQIPPVSDSKPAGGGGTGRSRTEIREDQLGSRVSSLLVAAVERDLLSRSQAVDFLDIPEAAFDTIADVGSSLGGV